jgi:ribosomal protein S18 acetylase RimI-like enzyme
MSPAIRPFVFTDKPSVMHILKNLPEFEPHEVAIAEELIDAYLDDPVKSGYFLLVSEDAGEVKGYICYGPTPLTMGAWDIYWIAVSPGSKGHGLGTAMMEKAEKDILKAGGYLIIVETSSKPLYENTRMFYDRRGYKVICSIKDFYSRGDDKVMLGKWFEAGEQAA